MGGLRKVMPVTFWTMLIGSLSLAGFPLFAGFWSKDEILTLVAKNGSPILLGFALITVFLTAFYTFRMFIMTFGGEYRGHHHPHESPWVMTGPLLILAVPALLVGFWGSPVFGYGFFEFLKGIEGTHYHLPAPDFAMMAIGTVLGLAGIAFAWAVYGMKTISAVSLGRAFGPMHGILLNRWYVDELYMKIIDVFAIGLGKAISAFDRGILDGLINGGAGVWRMFGSGLRTFQTGRVQNYGLFLFSGVVVIAFALVFASGAVRP
jgi:NADH-quinone oxidoreductase subunit L